MPIATGTAIVIAGAAALGGSLYSSSKASKAAEQQTEAIAGRTAASDKISLEQWDRFKRIYGPLEEQLVEEASGGFTYGLPKPDRAAIEREVLAERGVSATGKGEKLAGFESQVARRGLAGAQRTEILAEVDKRFAAAMEKYEASRTFTGSPGLTRMMAGIDRGFSDIAANTRRTLGGRFPQGAGLETLFSRDVEL